MNQGSWACSAAAAANKEAPSRLKMRGSHHPAWWPLLLGTAVWGGSVQGGRAKDTKIKTRRSKCAKNKKNTFLLCASQPRVIPSLSHSDTKQAAAQLRPQPPSRRLLHPPLPPPPTPPLAGCAADYTLLYSPSGAAAGLGASRCGCLGPSPCGKYPGWGMRGRSTTSRSPESVPSAAQLSPGTAGHGAPEASIVSFLISA